MRPILQTNKAQLHFPFERNLTSKEIIESNHKDARHNWKFFHIDSIEEDDDLDDRDFVDQRRSIENRALTEHNLIPHQIPIDYNQIYNKKEKYNELNNVKKSTEGSGIYKASTLGDLGNSNVNGSFILLLDEVSKFPSIPRLNLGLNIGSIVTPQSYRKISTSRSSKNLP